MVGVSLITADIDTSEVHVRLWQWSQWAQSSKLYAKWSNRVGNISQTGNPFIQMHTKRCLTFVFGVILVHCDKRNPRYTFKRVRDQSWLVTCPDRRHAITWTNAKCCQYDPAEHNIQWECKHSCGNMCKIVVNYFRQQYVQRKMRDNVARLYCMNFARLRGDILSLSLGCILLIFTTMKIICYFGGKYFAYVIYFHINTLIMLSDEMQRADVPKTLDSRYITVYVCNMMPHTVH